MYTIIRKLTMVCLAVVFSVLVYGCGGGGSEQATTTTMMDGPGMPHSVSTELVTAGLTIMPGTYNIPSGETADAGDATFACPAEESACEVTVELNADGTTTTTSLGGMATAMNSAAADERIAEEEDRLAALRAVENSVDTSTVTVGLVINPGTFTIEPGETSDRHDATFTCPAGEVACVVTVEFNADGTTTTTSLGGAATAMNSAAGAMKLAASNPIMGMLTTGLTSTPGGFTLQPGESSDRNDATFTCSAGGLPCVVTVAVDGTGTSAGGTAAVMNSAVGYARLNKVNVVDVSKLATGYQTISEGTRTIQPGLNMNVGDANFACPAGGVPCVITVDAESTVTSLGGAATARNTMAVMTTRTAKALSDSATEAALRTPYMEGTGAPNTDFSGVERSPVGVITITLKDVEADMAKFSSVAVDPGHEISGWMGQTLTRDNRIKATEDTEAVMATDIEKATVYTNIDAAKAGKWKITGTDLPDPDPDVGDLVFAIDPSQEDFTEELRDHTLGWTAAEFTARIRA